MADDLPSPVTWPDLMRRAQDGDQRAYSLVLRALLPAVRACARRRLFDEAGVEDVVQDTLLSIHRLRHTYDPARPLLPWVVAIASARAIDTLRKQGRSRDREVSGDLRLAEMADGDAMAAMEAADMGQELGRLLGLLPERQRMVVEMVKLREMSLDDAADESRLSVPAIKSLLHRAYAKLRDAGRQSDG
jgi:RNA polymerase sigma-70 factor (ECF subfamily)